MANQLHCMDAANAPTVHYYMLLNLHKFNKGWQESFPTEPFKPHWPAGGRSS